MSNSILKKKTYFMILISVFTFFGESTMLNLSSFTNVFNDQQIEVDFAAEEEKESSNSKEKEVVNAQIEHDELAILQCNHLNSIAFHKCLLNGRDDFSEVTTPPPELFIG